MQGYIRKRGQGSYQITIDLPRGVDGERRQKFISIKGTKREAQAKLAELQHEINGGTYIDPKKLTLGGYLRQWLPQASTGLSGKTAERYAEIVEKHLIPALGGIEIAKLKPLHIQAYYTEALVSGRRDGKGGLAARTIEYHHHVLHKALNDAVKWELMMRNPASVVQVPKADEFQGDPLTGEEVTRLLFAARGTAWYISVLLAVTTGMRRGEICALTWDNVDLLQGKLAVRQTLEATRQNGLRFKEPKTAKSKRVIDLLPMTVEALKQHRKQQDDLRYQLGGLYQDNNLICCKDDGQPYNPDSISHNFHRVIDRADLQQRRFHDLRHTHATLMLEIGIPPKVVQERLGHSSIVVTQDRYTHVLPTVQKDAATKLQFLLNNQFIEDEKNGTDHSLNE